MTKTLLYNFIFFFASIVCIYSGVKLVQQTNTTGQLNIFISDNNNRHFSGYFFLYPDPFREEKAGIIFSGKYPFKAKPNSS